jgi:hypothetical protein
VAPAAKSTTIDTERQVLPFQYAAQWSQAARKWKQGLTAWHAQGDIAFWIGGEHFSFQQGSVWQRTLMVRVDRHDRAITLGPSGFFCLDFDDDIVIVPDNGLFYVFGGYILRSVLCHTWLLAKTSQRQADVARFIYTGPIA